MQGPSSVRRIHKDNDGAHCIQREEQCAAESTRKRYSELVRLEWDRMDQRAAGKRATLAGSQQELFSLTAATSRGMTVEISGDGCVVKKSERIVAMGSRRGNLIKLTVEATAECHSVENEAEL